MDKYEYKVRADEIKTLISQGEYDEAVKIADTIDWRRVKSVMMLCTISDLYKINRRYEDSRDILLLAYERHAGGRLIVYSLCELSIKLGEFVQALEYYKEFVQLAPKDSGRYILQYKLYEAQEVSLEERIEVLEELKKRDYREKWAYELAYLYHRVGLASKCVEECDEMFLWFGEGRYVLKGLELKMLHEPLSEEQQAKYDQMKQTGGFITPDYVVDQQEIQEKAGEATEEEEDNEFSLEENILTDDTQEIPGKEDIDIQVKTVDVSQYNTINLQKELAESMKEFLEQNKTQEMPVQETNELLKTKVYEPVAGLDSPAPAGSEESEDTSHQHPDKVQENSEEALVNEGSEEVFFGNTEEVNIQDLVSELAQKNGSGTLFAPVEEQVEMPEVPVVDTQAAEPKPSLAAASPNPAISNTGVIRTFHKPSGYDDILTQEYDGQISLVVPEQEKVEKQITGQLSIEDIMAEWERMKQENERKRMEEIRKRVQQQTDTLFADFDESTKSGLLENLEKAMVTAAIKEEKLKAAQERPKVVKVADIDKQEEKQASKPEPEDIEKIVEIEEVEEEQIEEIEPEEIEEIQDEETEEFAEVEEIEEAEENKKTEEAEETPQEDIKAKEAEEPVQEAQAQEESEEAVKTDPGPRKKGKKKRTENKEETGEKEDKDKQKAKEEEEGENKYTAREMSGSEKEQFAPFIHHKRTRRQIVEAIDNISMASYTGNVIITGEEGTGSIELAKLLVKEIQLSDSNFSGKVAKISGVTMNKKDVGATLSKLANGALIIESAAGMRKATVGQLLKELNQEEKGLIVLMEDTKARMNDFLAKYAELVGAFNLRVDLEALDDQTLVKYAKKYALDQEYAIDELGVLALHTRIADMQTSDHEVTLSEIEELIDEAIYYADKKTPKHFFDVLLGKRYDDEDMIVLREKDFMHY